MLQDPVYWTRVKEIRICSALLIACSTIAWSQLSRATDICKQMKEGGSDLKDPCRRSASKGNNKHAPCGSTERARQDTHRANQKQPKTINKSAQRSWQWRLASMLRTTHVIGSQQSRRHSHKEGHPFPGPLRTASHRKQT